jgi:hypothetical protein
MSDFLRAARYTDQKAPLPHQMAAWNWAWAVFPLEHREQFLEMFRAAVPDKQEMVNNNWAGVMAAAKQAGARFPELVAAQWALESGWGQYITGTHNYFGQKGPGTIVRTSEVVNGQTVQVDAEFLNFRSMRESITYLVDRWHLDFRSGDRLYRGVNHAPNRDAAAQALVAEGYATDPDYAAKVIRLMNQNAPLVQTPEPARLAPLSPFTNRITPHIRLGEFALDQEARRFQHQHQVDTAAELAAFLERVRLVFGKKPVIITSGYRPAAINRQVGGATSSEHLYAVAGEGAVDFMIEGADMQAVQRWCDEHWPHSLGLGAAKGFVHLGRRADGKRRRWTY